MARRGDGIPVRLCVLRIVAGRGEHGQTIAGKALEGHDMRMRDGGLLPLRAMIAAEIAAWLRRRGIGTPAAKTDGEAGRDQAEARAEADEPGETARK